MALWVCERDGVRYAIGASACPQCGAPSEQGHEQTEADDMPKINRQDQVSYREAELAGEAGPWSQDQDGANSETSSPSGERNPNESDESRRQPARTTENPSDRTPEDDQSARSTGGDQPERDADQVRHSSTSPKSGGGAGEKANAETTAGTTAKATGRAASRPQAK